MMLAIQIELRRVHFPSLMQRKKAAKKCSHCSKLNAVNASSTSVDATESREEGRESGLGRDKGEIVPVVRSGTA
jgi:hypothetical protein